jgi:diguanylate cyclase (GGDEF)-like protein
MAANANSIRTAPTTIGAETLEQENLELKSRIAALENLVLLDTLTPLYNRRYFMDMLDRWIWRANRHGADCGILFIDVDQMKAVNDAFGHLAGDNLLISVAQTLRSSVRRSDIVARIGGDEFGILLEKVDAASMPGKASKIANAVAAQPVDHAGHNIVASVSVGFAMIEAHVPASDTLNRADNAMYADKARRRSAIG